MAYKYENYKNLKGEIKGKFVVLHTWSWDRIEQGDDVYVPRKVMVNPKLVECIEELTGSDTHSAKIYYSSKNTDTIIEKFSDVENLFAECMNGCNENIE